MTSLRSLVFLCLINVLCFEETSAASPVKATIYYEAKCGDSRKFILQQLLPAVLREPELIHPVLIPFGKANVTEASDGYEFTCQHGESECIGNKIHACAIAAINNPQKQVEFVACVMSNFTDVWGAAFECSTELGLLWDPVENCANGTTGNELLRAYGNITKGLDPPLTSLPTITINEVIGNQSATLNDFWGEIVKASEGIPSNNCPEMAAQSRVLIAGWVLLLTMFDKWMHNPEY